MPQLQLAVAAVLAYAIGMRHHACNFLICITLLFQWPCKGAETRFDLTSQWDTETPLPNPHKGWYHHYPDNHIDKYKIARDSDLLEFPGMDHLYIRIAWAYMEPKEREFNWAIVDDLISKWTANNLGIAFRISCKETSTDRPEQQYATPSWVKEAGAKGGHYRMGKTADTNAPWEPVFDDPVYLEKLEAFLRAFAARYDGKPWLRYIDIGSIGDWGEGHTWAGSRIKYDLAARKKHIDLHLRIFKRSQLIISDDFVFETGNQQERAALHRYVMENRIGYRDDSILVNGYFAGHSATATVRSPEFFQESYLKNPVVLELEHYSAVKKQGNWTATEQSEIRRHGGGRNGPQMLTEALETLKATYIGYHGDAAEWLRDNPELTRALLNRCGYWYFPHSVRLEGPLGAKKAKIYIGWENRGVAPAYVPFKISFRLEGNTIHDAAFSDSGNRAWLPATQGGPTEQAYHVAFPGASNGEYTLKVKLSSSTVGRDILLPLKAELRDADGFYKIAKVRVGE